MKQVRYGMVGGSLNAFIGEVHRKALNFDTRVELVAGCFSDVKEDNIETGTAYNIDSQRLYENYKEMAEQEGKRDDKIDFVSITTPNFLHYDIAKLFLNNGINVVCEKPLCFKVEEAEELERISKEKNLIFAVTYAYTGYTMVKVMREAIADGKIGKIIAVNAEYAQQWLIDSLSQDDPGTAKLSAWRTDPKYTGISNCVGDIGTHTENLVHYITGLKIKRVSATTNNFGQALELNANLLVEYENGANGAYWFSQVAIGNLNGCRVRIYGELGAMEWDQEAPDHIVFTPKGMPTEKISRGCGYLTENSGKASRIPAGHPEGYYIAFANTYRNIVDAVIKQKAGEIYDPASYDFQTVTDGLNGVKFVHAVIESAKTDSAWKNIT